MRALSLVTHTNTGFGCVSKARRRSTVLHMLLILVARLCTCHTRWVGASCHRVYMLRNHPADNFTSLLISCAVMRPHHKVYGMQGLLLLAPSSAVSLRHAPLQLSRVGY